MKGKLHSLGHTWNRGRFYAVEKTYDLHSPALCYDERGKDRTSRNSSLNKAWLSNLLSFAQ